MSSLPCMAVKEDGLPAPTQAQSTRAVVAEANSIIREGLCSFLRNARIEVMAQEDAACEVTEHIARLLPDVVLLSVATLGQEELGALQAIRRLAPRVGIVVLDMHGDPGHLLQAIAHGATCYLTGSATQEDLVAAVRAAAAGRSLVDREALLNVARLVSVERNAAPPEDPLDALTPREREVLSLLTEGMSNQRIADELGVSIGTVKTHICNVLSKLHMADRLQAAVWATRRGVGPRVRRAVRTASAMLPADLS